MVHLNECSIALRKTVIVFGNVLERLTRSSMVTLFLRGWGEMPAVQSIPEGGISNHDCLSVCYFFLQSIFAAYSLKLFYIFHRVFILDKAPAPII